MGEDLTADELIDRLDYVKWIGAAYMRQLISFATLNYAHSVVEHSVEFAYMNADEGVDFAEIVDEHEFDYIDNAGWMIMMDFVEDMEDHDIDMEDAEAVIDLINYGPEGPEDEGGEEEWEEDEDYEFHDEDMEDHGDDYGEEEMEWNPADPEDIIDSAHDILDALEEFAHDLGEAWSHILCDTIEEI